MARVSGHATHGIGVDERGEGHRRTRVAWRYERVPDQRRCVVLRPDHGLEVADQVDDFTTIISDAVIPAEPDLLEHP